MLYPALNPKTLSQLPAYVGVPEHLLHQFLRVAGAPDTVWLLGAGASSPLRPTWSKLRTSIIDASLDQGGYPAEVAPLTAFKLDLVRDTSTKTTLDWWKRFHTPDDFFRLHYESDLLGTEARVGRRPQFQIFEYLPNSNVILTTNQDGLLHHFSSSVLCLHGCVYEGFWFAARLDEVRKDALSLRDLRYDAAAEWGIDPGPTPWLYFPRDSASGELHRRLDLAAELVASANALVVIGYSFSDPHLLEMLTAVMGARRSPCPTIVIDADPKIDRSESLRDIWCHHDVQGVRVRWDSLAPAIASVACRHSIANISMLRAHVDEICLELQILDRKFPLLTEEEHPAEKGGH